jgi:hypothetical protein
MSQEEQKYIYSLWDKCEDNIMEMFICKTSIYIEVKINGEQIKCLLDTGAQINVIDIDIIKKLKLDNIIDTRYKNKIIGVGGTCEVIGHIPYIDIELPNGKLCSITIQVVNNKSDKMILGLPFMLFYNVIMNMKTRKITLMDEEIDFKILDK